MNPDRGLPDSKESGNLAVGWCRRGAVERRWVYVALVSLGCFELRLGHAESAEQAPDTMEARDG